MKLPEDAKPDVMLLRNREIPVYSCALPQMKLKFYAENPRIYSSVWVGEDEKPTQEKIFEVLSKAEHVRETLVPSIRNNGGLIEPILVRDGVVLEGNSRLAAYRILSDTDEARWSLIRARVLPDTVTDSEVFSLLGEYHMVGKKDWPPYEQAGYLYRRFKNHEISEKELAAEVGLSEAKVRHAIHVYSFMVDHDDRHPNKWSYYDELLKGRRFDKAREQFPGFDEIIAKQIKHNEIARAVDLRDQLPQITKMGGNTLRRLMKGSLSLDEAAEEARLRGAGNYHLEKLRKFRSWLGEESIDGDIDEMSADEIKQVKFELEKTHTRLGQLIKRVMRPRMR